MLTHHPNVPQVLWHVRRVLNRTEAFIVVEMSSNEDGNEQKFDNTADQHCWSSLLSVSTEMFTYLPMRCDASLCEYLYTILSHHSTCEDRLWKSRFCTRNHLFWQWSERRPGNSCILLPKLRKRRGEWTKQCRQVLLYLRICILIVDWRQLLAYRMYRQTNLPCFATSICRVVGDKKGENCIWANSFKGWRWAKERSGRAKGAKFLCTKDKMIHGSKQSQRLS